MVTETEETALNLNRYLNH